MARSTFRDAIGEIAIIIVGSIASVVSAVVVQDGGLAVVIALVTLLLAVSTFVIRLHVTTQVTSTSRLHAAADSIGHNGWRNEAAEEIQLLEGKFRGWSDGSRRLAKHQSIPYQIQLLKGAGKSVDAIHNALNKSTLEIWDDQKGSFSAQVAAYQSLKKSVKKRRRILVLDSTDSSLSQLVGGSRIIQDEMVLRVCRRQIDDLRVKLFILWSEDLAKVEDGAIPPDLLIVDDAEAVIVRIINDELYEALAYVDNRVHVEQTRFDRYLAVATPADRAMGAETGKAAGREQAALTVVSGEAETPPEPPNSNAEPASTGEPKLREDRGSRDSGEVG